MISKSDNISQQTYIIGEKFELVTLFMDKYENSNEKKNWFEFF